MGTVTENWFEIGIKKSWISLDSDKIKYLKQNKNYNFSRPEEKVRASYYIELLEKYGYSADRIEFEVLVPRRKPEDKADIVIFEDDEHKKPYIVVECKREGISAAEIVQADEQAIGNANSLRAKYSILVAGTTRIARNIAGFPQQEREKNVIADIPVKYGQVIKYKFKKEDEIWDLKIVSEPELQAKFQQCHDTLWEGGKRNPAEAFDEMSKLMYCKIHDERFITKIGESYRFQIGTNETAMEVARRVREIYQIAHKLDPEVFLDPIKVDDPVIFSVVEVLQGISLSKTELDAKGIAFEHFLGSVFRGEMGKYFTPRQIVEFMVDFLEPTEADIVIDPSCGSGGFLIYVLDKIRKDLTNSLSPNDARDRWTDFAKYQIYGIEINSQLSRVAMMNMILHEDGHSNIVNRDALVDPDKFDPRRDIKLGKYTLLLTNPPFGAEVKLREKDYLQNYELGKREKVRERQSTEILFIERCIDFLQPGKGRMGIVLPEGILSNSSLQYVRDFLLEKARILGVVSLPQGAFTPFGAGVKSSLLFLRRRGLNEVLPKDYPIFMALVENIGYDTTGRPTKNDLKTIIKQWEKFNTGRFD